MRSDKIDSIKLKHTRNIFTIIAFTLTLLTLSFYMDSGNILQYRASLASQNKLLLHENLMSLLTLIFIMTICLFNKFQRLDYQRALLLCLITPLVLLPATHANYLVMVSFPRAIANLIQAWIQLYVPPSIRASTSGLIASLAGFIEIRSVYAESHGDYYISIKNYYSILLAVFFILFWKYTRLLEKACYKKNIKQNPQLGVVKLILDYPYIFFGCFLEGLNYNMIFNSEFLAKTSLPNNNPQLYQYVLYSGATILPFIAGRFGDKFGIKKGVVYSICSIICVKLITSIIMLFHLDTPVELYFLIFIEAGLAGSMWALNASLIGEMIDKNNLFRAFSLSLLILFLGAFLDGKIYQIFPSSLILIKFTEACVNFLFVLLFYYSSKKLIEKY